MDPIRLPSLAVCDDHVHSLGSCDGHEVIPALCQAALARGLAGLTITDHFDTDPSDHGYGLYDYDALWRAVEEARAVYGDRLQVLIGAEVCFQPVFARRIADFLAACPLDFVLGSVHYVGREFVDRAYFARHGAAGYAAYLEAVEEAVASGLFDSLGHLDYAKRHGTEPCGPFDPGPHWERIERILRQIVARGMALEVNTAGWRHPPAEPYPSEAVLRRYRELGGTRITLGSDAHRAELVGHEFARAVELARRAGFTHQTHFVGRQPQLAPFGC